MNKYIAYLGFGLVVALIMAGSLWCASCRDWFQTKSVPVVTGTGAWQDQIKITSLKPGETVASPLLIKGETRGTWFFEGSFPVTLVDWDGKIIAQVPATATGEWMTTEYVPFTVTLDFTPPAAGSRGAIIFKKDNPSGLPQNEASIELPIRFK